MVYVRKAVVYPAETIVLSPTKPNIDIKRQAEAIKSKLIDKPVVSGDIVDIIGSFTIRKTDEDPMDDIMKMMPFFKGGKKGPTLGTLRLVVEATEPAGRVVKIDRRTIIKVNKKVVLLSTSGDIITYDDVGGLTEAIQKIREMIELPLKHPELFQRLNIEPPKGVLFYGPPGTGKTLMAKAVSQESKANFFTINGPEIMSKFYGASEGNLRAIFEKAERNAPAIIFIDEIDSIAPKRQEITGEVERRVVAQLLSVMDGLKGREDVICIGATNRVDALDPALRRPGRFDREIVFGVPDKNARKEIFQIHTRGMPFNTDVDLDRYSEISYGYTGADIMAVCREAAMFALRKILPKINLDEPIPSNILQELKIFDEDFIQAINIIKPSAMREIIVEVPNVSWEDVGGLHDVKNELKEAVEWPLNFPHLFERAGIRPLNGILIFGPPGCGKTLLAKAVATESKSNFISVKGPEVYSKWVGESEKRIREIFIKARQVAPSIVYFDEIEALAYGRGLNQGSQVYDTVINQLLVELDGIENRKGVVVIASTNRPDIVDPAFLRPGRIDRLVFVEAPDLEGREEILKVHTRTMPLTKDVSLKKLALLTEGFSGADLENLTREAGMNAIRKKMQDFKEVEMEDFELAMTKIKSTLPKEILDRYVEMAKQITESRNIAETRADFYK